MNMRKIKVKLTDRPKTLMCSIFDDFLRWKCIDRNRKGILSSMLKYTDKVYAMIRKKYCISDEAFIEVFMKYIIVYGKNK